MWINGRTITLAAGTVSAMITPTLLAFAVVMLKPANAYLYYQVLVASVALLTLLLHKMWKAPRSRFGRQELWDLSEYTQEQFDALRMDFRVGRLYCYSMLISLFDLVATLVLTGVFKSSDSFLGYIKKNWFVCILLAEAIILSLIGDFSFRRKIANAKVLTEEALNPEKGSVDDEA